MLVSAVHWLLEIIKYAILARVIISWLPISKENPLIRLLYQITEPILGPIRKLIEKSAVGGGMMFDFSPVIAFFVISLVQNIVVRYFSNIQL